MYLRFFNLTEPPFHVTPDPNFLFETGCHKEALAAMVYGIRERKGFISISGEIGTGKTTLIHQLMNTLGRKVKIVPIYQTYITFEELLKQILFELELPTGDGTKTSMVRQLNRYLIQRLARDETLAIIIDEAQNLGIDILEELRMLSNLESDTSKLIQIVLVGQPELEDKLNGAKLRQLRQRIGIRRRLLPLGEKESRQYMEHRLKRSGSSLSAVFTSEAVSLICRAAGGTPRTINMICDNALLIGYSLTQKPIDAAIVKEALADLHLVKAKGPARIQQRQKAQARAKTRHARGFTFGKFSYVLWVPVAAAMVLFGGEEYLRTIVSKALEKFPIGSSMVQEGSVIRPSGEKPKEDPRTASQKYFRVPNTTLADYLLQFNMEIIDFDRLWIRQESDLPEISDESVVIQASDGAYRIWLGTFLRADYAGFLMMEPALEGKQIFVEARKVSPEKTWYRAIAGDFATKEECLKTVQVLKKKGLLPIFVGFGL